MRTELTAVEPLAGVLSDEEVIARVRDGDTALFEVIMRRYNQRLYRTVRAILKDDTEAEDVMQDAYVRAYQHLDQFRGQAAFSTWLTRIAINEALSRIRRRFPESRRDDQAETDMMDYPDDRTPSPEKQTLNSELRNTLEAALEEMPRRYRSVLILRDVEGLSTAEAADCLGVSVEAAKVSLHRARVHLRGVLERQCGAAVSEMFQFQAPRCDRVVRMVLARIALLH